MVDPDRIYATTGETLLILPEKQQLFMKSMAPVDQSARLAALQRINANDILESFGWPRTGWSRPLLERAVARPARRFAQTMLAFDRRVGSDGLREGARWALAQFSAALRVEGAENVPQSGPLLLLSNHPGICDTLALFVAIDRPNLSTIAADRPFLRELGEVSQRLIYVAEQAGGQLSVVRAVTAQLRAGHAVLTFPAGRIEPDPAHRPGVWATLAEWSASVDLFVRLAPETAVVPVLVSGIFSGRALASPVTHLRRAPSDRERLAAMLQVIAPSRYPVSIRVRFGAPIFRHAADAGRVTHAAAKAIASMLP